jgi:hypothetical protein
MMTQFVTTEIALPATAGELPLAIAAALNAWGDPLRWAITSVDVDRQRAVVEAIVTTPATDTR